jgi:hypothetical protein
LRKNCPKSFQASSLFKVAKVLSRNENFSNLYNLPEIFRHNKDSQTAEKISSILKNISQKFSRVPKNFEQHGEKDSQVSASCPNFLTGLGKPLHVNGSTKGQMNPIILFYLCVFVLIF